MKPILFSENSTTFTTNGIGRLSDAFECVVTEERNGIYELEMTYPMEGAHYSDIAIRKIIVAKPSANASPEPFRVYKITKPINGKVKIYAQHISYDLSKNTTMPFTVAASGTACNTVLQTLKANAVESCPFTFWTDVTTVASYTQKLPASIKQRLGGIEGSVLDQFGGEYEYVGLTVKLWRSRGSQRDITLRYGKNITDLQQEENIANTVTGVVPFWTDIDNTEVVTLTEKAVYSSHASQYSNKLTVPLDLSSEWENQPTQTQLRDAATIYVNQDNFGIPTVSTKVDFVNLADTEEYKDILPLQNVNLCDTIKVQFEKLGIDTTAKIVKTTYNVLAERYDSIEVGSLRSNLASTITDIEKNSASSIEKNGKRIFAEANSEAQDIVNSQTAWLTSANGYVIAVKNNAGEWKELIFADHPDPEEWRNILRINELGIGFSSDGGATYRQAWTLDGNLHADFITTGLLKSASSDNYWNLDTGEFCLVSTSKVKDLYTNYTGTTVPSNYNYPASSWTDYEQKKSHIGETYYNSNNHKYYKYQYNANSGATIKFASESATETGWDYVEIYYTKDGKWYKSPKYDGGYNGSTNNIANKEVFIPVTTFYVYWKADSSNTAWGFGITTVGRATSGTNVFTEYDSDPRPSISDWTYTTMANSWPHTEHPYGNNEQIGWEFDTTSWTAQFEWVEYDPTVTLGNYVENSIDENLDQETIYNTLTNNGETQGIYMQNGKLYLNAEYMGAGALKIGGSGHTAIPSIIVQDASNNIIFQANANALQWNTANSSMSSNGAITANGTFNTTASKSKGSYTYTRRVSVGDGAVKFTGATEGGAYNLGSIEGDFQYVSTSGTVNVQGKLGIESRKIDIRTDDSNTPAIAVRAGDTSGRIYIRASNRIDVWSHGSIDLDAETGFLDLSAADNISITAGDDKSVSINAGEIYLSANDIYLSGNVHGI